MCVLFGCVAAIAIYKFNVQVPPDGSSEQLRNRNSAPQAISTTTMSDLVIGEVFSGLVVTQARFSNSQEFVLFLEGTVSLKGMLSLSAYHISEPLIQFDLDRSDPLLAHIETKLSELASVDLHGAIRPWFWVRNSQEILEDGFADNAEVELIVSDLRIDATGTDRGNVLDVLEVHAR